MFLFKIYEWVNLIIINSYTRATVKSKEIHNNYYCAKGIRFREWMPSSNFYYFEIEKILLHRQCVRDYRNKNAF